MSSMDAQKMWRYQPAGSYLLSLVNLMTHTCACIVCCLSTCKDEVTNLKNQVSSLSNNELALLRCNQVCTVVSDPSSSSSSCQEVSNINANVNLTHTLVLMYIVKSFIAEEKEKSRRRLNLAIHCVSESTASVGHSRKSSILEKCIGSHSTFRG